MSTGPALLVIARVPQAHLTDSPPAPTVFNSQMPAGVSLTSQNCGLSGGAGLSFSSFPLSGYWFFEIAYPAVLFSHFAFVPQFPHQQS